MTNFELEPIEGSSNENLRSEFAANMEMAKAPADSAVGNIDKATWDSAIAKGMNPEVLLAELRQKAEELSKLGKSEDQIKMVLDDLVEQRVNF